MTTKGTAAERLCSTLDFGRCVGQPSLFVGLSCAARGVSRSGADAQRSGPDGAEVGNSEAGVAGRHPGACQCGCGVVSASTELGALSARGGGAGRASTSRVGERSGGDESSSGLSAAACGG